MKLKVKKIKEEAKIPTRAHHNDAGVDLYSFGEHIVAPHSTSKISTGVAIEIAQGYVGLIWDKSSIGLKGLKVLGGVIDAGYRGEVIIMVHNLTDNTQVFSSGSKVAQMLVQKVELWDIEEVDDLDVSSRGEGGFGSTGI